MRPSPAPGLVARPRGHRNRRAESDRSQPPRRVGARSGRAEDERGPPAITAKAARARAAPSGTPAESSPGPWGCWSEHGPAAPERIERGRGDVADVLGPAGAVPVADPGAARRDPSNRPGPRRTSDGVVVVAHRRVLVVTRPAGIGPGDIVRGVGNAAPCPLGKGVLLNRAHFPHLNVRRGVAERREVSSVSSPARGRRGRRRRRDRGSWPARP